MAGNNIYTRCHLYFLNYIVKVTNFEALLVPALNYYRAGLKGNLV